MKIDPNKLIQELEHNKILKKLDHPEAAKEYISEFGWYLNASRYHYNKFITLCSEPFINSLPLEAEITSFIFCLHSSIESIPYGVSACLNAPCHSHDIGWRKFNEWRKEVVELQRLNKIINSIRKDNQEYTLLDQSFANAIKHRHPIRITLPDHLQSDLEFKFSKSLKKVDHLIFKSITGYESKINDIESVNEVLVRLHNSLSPLLFEYYSELVSLIRKSNRYSS